MKHIKKTIRSLRKLHRFSRDAIHGSLQFTIVLYIFAFAAYYIAPYTPDYFRAMAYYAAALEIAPATLGAGIVAALISDLALRSKDGDDDAPPSNRQ